MDRLLYSYKRSRHAPVNQQAGLANVPCSVKVLLCPVCGCLKHAHLSVHTSFTCLSNACRMPFACLSRIFHMPFACLSHAFRMPFSNFLHAFYMPFTNHGWIVVPAICQVADHPGSVIDGSALTLAGTHIITHPPTLSLARTSFNDSPIHSLIIESIKCIMLSCLS